MPTPRRPRYIFISHSYRDADLYHRLIDELRKRPNFSFQDRSVPDIRQIEARHIKPVLKRKISESDVMLIFTRPIATRSPMIKYEIDAAKRLGKPIIAIKPAEGRNVSKAVRRAAKVLIDWDIEEIVRQIRNPGSTPIKHITPVFEVNDTANVPMEISPSLTGALRRRISFKEAIMRTFNFRWQRSTASATPPVSGMGKFEEDADGI